MLEKSAYDVIFSKVGCVFFTHIYQDHISFFPNYVWRFYIKKIFFGNKGELDYVIYCVMRFFLSLFFFFVVCCLLSVNLSYNHSNFKALTLFVNKLQEFNDLCLH